MNSENKTLEIELDQFILWFIKQEHITRTITCEVCQENFIGQNKHRNQKRNQWVKIRSPGAHELRQNTKNGQKKNYGLHPSRWLGSGCERSNPRKKHPFLWALPKLTPPSPPPPPFYCDLFSKLGYAKDGAQDVSRLLHRFVKVITGSELSLHSQCLGQLCLWQCLRVEFGTG